MMKPEVKQTGSLYIMNQNNEYVKLCDIDEMCYVFDDRVYCEECAKEHHVYACREDDED